MEVYFKSKIKYYDNKQNLGYVRKSRYSVESKDATWRI